MSHDHAIHYSFNVKVIATAMYSNLMYIATMRWESEFGAFLSRKYALIIEIQHRYTNIIRKKDHNLQMRLQTYAFVYYIFTRLPSHNSIPSLLEIVVISPFQKL